MEKEFTFIKMVLDMKESGKMINYMVQDMNLGQMAQIIKVVMQEEKNKVKENINGQMAQLMMANGMIILLMDTEFIIGKMADLMKEIGQIIKCMVKVFILGMTEENIMVILKIM